MANNSSASLLRKPQHILELNVEEKRRFVESFDRVYSDIDGVIWTMEYNVPNAADGYAALEHAGKAITYVTNNSARTVESTVSRFAKLDMQVSPEQIWHPAQTLIYYLRSINFDGLIYIIATPKFKALLRDAGYQLIDGPNHFIEESFEDLARNIFDKQPVRAVVIDVDFNLTSTKLLRAHMYLRHPDCLLLTGATDRLLPVAKGVNIIGPGPFASILIEASGKEPSVLGKPGRELGNMLMQQHKVSSPERVLMIGDMLAQDIKFGRLCGFQTLLVLTGGCTLDQLKTETSSDLLPDYYADSMADFVKLFEEVTPRAHV
ncbi:pyridoxal phosphate phosphatase [Drosophila innubila]|uniref:pyridoxal phosphate phosphatase n=1 Tax=Drosophila innubila TaxID=198719 RepID=UPI00148DD6D7|nr:pyridoxal phosphate phosphatase [Drosophila innubila]XP_034489674.1 pyridoxal phosphate phosphatase [Drosophila innubila]XP_034489675.1 pyridoxal phosphate phosphatase [Drosophila innubila]